jgi:hypothetical protein
MTLRSMIARAGSTMETAGGTMGTAARVTTGPGTPMQAQESQ